MGVGLSVVLTFELGKEFTYSKNKIMEINPQSNMKQMNYLSNSEHDFKEKKQSKKLLKPYSVHPKRMCF